MNSKLEKVDAAFESTDKGSDPFCRSLSQTPFVADKGSDPFCRFCRVTTLRSDGDASGAAWISPDSRLVATTNEPLRISANGTQVLVQDWSEGAFGIRLLGAPAETSPDAREFDLSQPWLGDGTPGDDHLVGDDRDDVVLAGAGGNDHIEVGGGDDAVTGGSGGDLMEGGFPNLSHLVMSKLKEASWHL